MIWAWHHGEQGEPFYDVPEVPELFDPEWLPYEIVEFDVATCCQEMAENNVDFAHFMYVHGTDAIPDDDFFIDGSYKRTVGADGNFVREGFGLGLGVLRIKGYTTFISSTTPIDEENVKVRWIFTSPVANGPDAAAASRGELLRRREPGPPDLGEQALRRTAGADEEREEAAGAARVGEAVLFELRGRQMSAWVGQYCLYVRDLERSVKFYEALGLACTSRTDLDTIKEAIVENPDKGGKLQLAQKLDVDAPIEMGNAFWKLYVATNDIERMFADAVAAGGEVASAPVRMEQWPMSVGFVKDPDGYLVELTQRHPWKDGDTSTYAWLNQYCIYVSDLERTIAFYELLGLECTSRTDIPHAKEAIVENTERGGKIQLAQQLDNDAPIAMGTAMWKLYVNTDDCEALHRTAVASGHTSIMDPLQPDRWPVTISFLADPDGYQVELVERHPDPA